MIWGVYLFGRAGEPPHFVLLRCKKLHEKLLESRIRDRHRARLVWSKAAVLQMLSTFVLFLVGSTHALRVAVSGAGGQTGQHVFRKLLAAKDMEPLGIVRTEESRTALLSSGVPEDSVVVADVTDAAALKSAVASCNAFVICTSAKPKPSDKTDEATGRPIFTFPNGSPEEVDWLGQKSQIDAMPSDAHCVICSSMGGTDPANMLNALGRVNNGDGSTSGGNILLWKRKAELYLIESGRPYTIVHPGGLINEPGGERELVVGVDDEREGTDSRTVPREDVAEVLVQALLHESYRGRSFDLRAKPVGDGSATTDFATLLDGLGGRNCDYTLGEIA